MSDWTIVDKNHQAPETPGYYEIREYDEFSRKFITSIVYVNKVLIIAAYAKWMPNGRKVVAYRKADLRPTYCDDRCIAFDGEDIYYVDPLTGARIKAEEHFRTIQITLKTNSTYEFDDIRRDLESAIEYADEEYAIVDIKEVTNE